MMRRRAPMRIAQDVVGSPYMRRASAAGGGGLGRLRALWRRAAGRAAVSFGTSTELRISPPSRTPWREGFGVVAGGPPPPSGDPLPGAVAGTSPPGFSMTLCACERRVADVVDRHLIDACRT